MSPPRRRTALSVLLLTSLLSAACWPTIAQQRQNDRALARISKHTPQTPFTFVAIGDPQGRYQIFEQVLKESSSVQPAFIVVMGDLTASGAAREYDAYCALLSRFDVPILSVIGNHDVRGHGKQLFQQKIGDPTFSFDYRRHRFIFLDTSGEGLDADQLSWLARQLDTTMISYVFTHRPPFMGNWWGHSFRKGTVNFLKLLDSSHVKRAFFGHLHIADGFWRNGVNYTIVGSGGIEPAILPFGLASIGFVLVRTSADSDQLTFHSWQPRQAGSPQHAAPHW